MLFDILEVVERECCGECGVFDKPFGNLLYVETIPNHILLHKSVLGFKFWYEEFKQIEHMLQHIPFVWILIPYIIIDILIFYDWILQFHLGCNFKISFEKTFTALLKPFLIDAFQTNISLQLFVEVWSWIDHSSAVDAAESEDNDLDDLHLEGR